MPNIVLVEDDILMQKAVAATESPSQTAPTPQTRPKNPHELAKFMAAKSASRNRV